MAGKGQTTLGQQYALAMIDGGEEAVRRRAAEAGSQLTMDAFFRVNDEDPVPAYLHSALCAMSLPIKQPSDPLAPIIREDGRYALMISPRPTLHMVSGKRELRTLGVPYGSYPRVALIYIMTQAVRRQSRDVFLGANFTDWMRKLGYKNMSWGKTGSVTRMRDQVDRLLACEWHIRWDGEGTADDNAFAVRDVRLANEYAGSITKDGAFAREIRLSEQFFTHLMEHAVPFNEVAIRELKAASTALDLYTYFASRLHRITRPNGERISFGQLAKHLGNDADTKRFRQTVRENMDLVSAVYPEAQVDMSGREIVMYPSPKPLEQKLIGRHLGLVGVGAKKPKPADKEKKAPRYSAPKRQSLTEIDLVTFPTGSIRFGAPERPYLEIALKHGRNWDVDKILEAFRAGFDGLDKKRSKAEWLKIWERFVISFANKRGDA